MNIYDFAIQFEKDGEAFYREIADKSQDEGIKSIMNMLADEEVKHAEILGEMKSRNPSIGDSSLFNDAKNVFQKMKEHGHNLNNENNQIEMYKKAQELEEQSKNFYLEKSNEVDNQAHAELLLKIADEERRHYFILETIIELVSRPDTWLENAEFNKLEDY